MAKNRGQGRNMNILLMRFTTGGNEEVRLERQYSH